MYEMWAERIRGGRATLSLFWALDEVNGSFEGIVPRPRERLPPGSGVVFGVQSLTDPGTGPGDSTRTRVQSTCSEVSDVLLGGAMTFPTLWNYQSV